LNAVPHEFTHHSNIRATNFILDFCADIAYASAFLRQADCEHECIFSHTQQLVCPFINYPDGNSRRVITNPALLNNADVELHDVSVLNTPLTADAVNNF